MTTEKEEDEPLVRRLIKDNTSVQLLGRESSLVALMLRPGCNSKRLHLLVTAQRRELMRPSRQREDKAVEPSSLNLHIVKNVHLGALLGAWLCCDIDCMAEC